MAEKRPLADFTAEELQSKKLPELKELLKERNLPISGNKDDLIQRLVTGEAPARKRRKSAGEEPTPVVIRPPTPDMTPSEFWDRVLDLESRLAKFEKAEETKKVAVKAHADMLVTAIVDGVRSQIHYKKNSNGGRIRLTFPIDYDVFLDVFAGAKEESNTKLAHTKTIVDDDTCQKVLNIKLGHFSLDLRYSGSMDVLPPLRFKYSFTTYALTVSGTYKFTK